MAHQFRNVSNRRILENKIENRRSRGTSNTCVLTYTVPNVKINLPTLTPIKIFS